MKIIWQSQWL